MVLWLSIGSQDTTGGDVWSKSDAKWLEISKLTTRWTQKGPGSPKMPQKRTEKVPKRVLAELWALWGGLKVQQEPQEAENYPKCAF